MFVEKLIPPVMAISFYVTLIFDLDDDLDLSTKEKVLPQGIHVQYENFRPLTIQTLWPMLRFLCRQTDIQSDRHREV